MLCHGTSPDVVDEILRSGLKPMGRQYVHLSPDRATATSVGGRKHATPVILLVDAKAADAAGIAFYRGNDHVWLADAVPPAFIAVG